MVPLLISCILFATAPADLAYGKANSSNAIGKETPKPTVEETSFQGKYLQLSDGSAWAIHPGDAIISQNWITPAEISISATNNTSYPYLLTNTLTGSSVRARRISKIPSAPPPPEPIPAAPAPK